MGVFSFLLTNSIHGICLMSLIIVERTITRAFYNNHLRTMHIRFTMFIGVPKLLYAIESKTLQWHLMFTPIAKSDGIFGHVPYTICILRRSTVVIIMCYYFVINGLLDRKCTLGHAGPQHDKPQHILCARGCCQGPIIVGIFDRLAHDDIQKLYIIQIVIGYRSG